jgi:uncharacterized membrane protein YgcG
VPIDVGGGRRIGPTHVAGPNRSRRARQYQRTLPPSNVSVGPESRTSARAEDVARAKIRLARREHRRLQLAIRRQQLAQLHREQLATPPGPYRGATPAVGAPDAAAAALHNLRVQHQDALHAFKVPALDQLKVGPTQKAPAPLKKVQAQLGQIQHGLTKAANAPARKAEKDAFQSGGEEAVTKYLKRRKADGQKFSNADLYHAYKKGGKRSLDEHIQGVMSAVNQPHLTAAPPGALEKAGHTTSEDQANAYMRVLGLHPHLTTGQKIYGTIADWAPLFVPAGGELQAVARGEHTITEALRGLRAVKALQRGGRAFRGIGELGGEVGARAGGRAFAGTRLGTRVRQDVQAAKQAFTSGREARGAARAASMAELRGQQIAEAGKLVRRGETSAAMREASKVAEKRPVAALEMLDRLATRTHGNFGAFAFLAGTPGGHNLITLPVQVSRAFIESQSVRDETFRALKALPREFVNGVASTAFKLITDPVSVPREFAQAYARTYGPLIAGNSAEFRRRLGERGGGGIIGPILDVAFIAAPGASFAAGKLAKEGVLGDRFARLMNEDRPLLQVGEGEGSARRQDASPRLFQRLRQERRDQARARYSKQQAEEARNAPYQEAIPKDSGRHHAAADAANFDAQGRPRVVVPRGRGTIHFRGRERGVTPRYPVELSRDTRAVARVKGQALVGRTAEAQRLVEGKTGAAPLLDSLSPQQQIAMFDVFQLGADISKPKRFEDAIVERIRQIKEHNVEHFGTERPHIPKKRLAAHDELTGLEQVLSALKGGTLIDERFGNVATQLKEIQREIEAENPRLSTVALEGGLSEADMRVAKPYAEFLVKLDRHRRAAGQRGIMPKFEGDFDSPDFAHYINDIVKRSKHHGLDAIEAKGKRVGLTRPHYVASERRDIERFSNRAIGGAKGVAKKQRYGGSLFRSGRQSRNPRVLLEGMRRGIKDKFQAKAVLDIAEGHGLQVLDRYKAHTMDWVNKHEGGIPDVIRSRGSGREINLREELNGLTPSQQFDVLVKRQVIDPWHVARAFVESDSARFANAEERNALLHELDRYKPIEHRDVNPFEEFWQVEQGRLAGLQRVLKDHSIEPPLLKAMFQAEARRYEMIRMTQPQGEPLLAKDLKGDLNGEFQSRMDSADKIRALYNEAAGSENIRQVVWSNIYDGYFGRDDAAFAQYMQEMKQVVYKATQDSLHHRGLDGKIIVWRVGDLNRDHPSVPIAFTLDPEPLADFRHQGREVAVPYEVHANDILGDTNALVHTGGFERTQGKLDDFELAALGDQAPGETGATGTHRYARENEVVIRPASVSKVAEAGNKEKIAMVQHAGQLRGTMKAKELIDAMDDLSLPTRDYVFYNPGVLYDTANIYEIGGARSLDQAQARSFKDAFQKASVDGSTGRDMLKTGEFSEVTGFVPIPRHVYDELAPVLNNWVGRSWDIGKNKFSRIILGLANVSWIVFQMGANAFLTGMAGVGPLEYLRAQQWWHSLDAPTKRAMEPILNIEPHLADTRERFMGFDAHDSDIAVRYQAFRDSDLANSFSKANIFRRIMDTSFRIDRAQTASFRRALFYNSIKKEALENMGSSLTEALAVQGKLTGKLFKRDDWARVEAEGARGLAEKQTTKLNGQIDALLRNKLSVEQHARIVDEWLGDYTTFTHAERQVLQRFTMFYGFLRHSTRFAFYTMPIKHPIMAGILGKLALMSDKETRDLLGIDDIPISLAGITFKLNGNIMQINFGRMSPTGNALFEASNPLAVFGLLPPMFTLPIAASGFNLFTGRYSQVRGENRYEAFQRGLGGLSLLDRIKLVAHDTESIIPPLRAYEQYAFKGPQGEDTSVIFGASPTQITTAKNAIQAEIKRQEQEGILGVVLRQFGTRTVDPGYLQYLRQQEADKRNKSIGSGSAGGYHFPSSSSSGGGFHYGGGSSGGSFNYGN